MVDGKPTLPEVLQVNKITCSVRPCCDMNNLTIILVYQSKFLNNINVLDTIELPDFSGDLIHFHMVTNWFGILIRKDKVQYFTDINVD